MISVVVPIYNVEKYVGDCIESLLRQTCCDFELILVDDGSTDSSGEICDRYAQADSRIRVIHKKNGGVSSARNAGINASRGDYIGFVDADDTVGKDYLLHLISCFDDPDEQVSVSAAGFSVCGEDGAIRSVLYRPAVCSPEEAAETEFDPKKTIPSVWGKLFRAELIREGGIRFSTGLTMGEDAFFLALVLTGMTGKYVFTGYEDYRYRRRSDSATSKYMSGSISLLRSFEMISECFENRFPKAYDLVCVTGYGYLTAYYRRALKAKDRELCERLCGKVRSDMRKIMKNSHMPQKLRITLLLIRFGLFFPRVMAEEE